MKYLLSILSVVFAFNCSVLAAQKEFTKILNKYSQARSVQVELKKTDEKMTLGTKNSSEGTLKFFKNKIYVVLNGEKKVEFIYNNKSIWLIEYPDQEFEKDGKRKVTELKKTVPLLMTSIINLFSNQKVFLKEFKVKNETKTNDELIVEFQPVQKNLKTFSLFFGLKDKTINKVVFVDDVDTKTTLELDKLKLNRKMNLSDFQYKKLKSDEVTAE